MLGNESGEMLGESGMLEDGSMLEDNSMLEDSSIIDTSALEDSSLMEDSSINNSTVNTGEHADVSKKHCRVYRYPVCIILRVCIEWKSFFYALIWRRQIQFLLIIW